MILQEAAQKAAEGGTEIDLSNPQELWSKVSQMVTDKGPEVLAHVVLALVLFVVGRWVARAVAAGIRKALVRGRLDEGVARFLGHLTYMLLLTLVVIAALQQLGVPTGSFIAIVGAAGLAIGFALQGSLSNFAAGVMIMVFRPFKTGDYVEAGGQAGIVEEVQVFMTLLRTPDNRLVIMPNGAITGGSIVNYSAKETRRIDLVFGVGYGDDLRKAREVLERVVRADPRVLADPAPTIALSELGESSVNFVVRPWVKGADYWPVRFDLTERVKLELDREGLTIPYPQRDVHLHQVA
jgi:small conductance mechanosensitive channel